MKCPKCGKDWPAGVKFCGACGSPMQEPGTPPGQPQAVTTGQIVDKVRALLSQINLGTVHEPSPGVFIIQKGSTHVEVRAIDVGPGRAAIRSTSPVTIGTPISKELLQFLMEENGRILFGAFGLGQQNEIVYTHTIMGTSVDVHELGSSVSSVVNMADKYDDEIVQRWGGKTREQVAMNDLLPAALMKALLQRKSSKQSVQPTKAMAHPPRTAPTDKQDVSNAIKVNSVGEEYVYVAQQRCSCGGGYNRDAQALLEIDGRYYDQLDLTCKTCGARRSMIFDINSFLVASKLKRAGLGLGNPQG